MPKKRINIPVDDPTFNVELFYIHEYKKSDPYHLRYNPLMYLHSIRSGDIKEDSHIAEAYRNNIKCYAEKLLNEFNWKYIDSVIGTPSSRDHINPYLSLFKRKFKPDLDLTGCFTKKSNFSAGLGNINIHTCGGIDYHCELDISCLKSILIIDDLFSTGTTAAIIIKLLKSHGVKDLISIALACPLLVS